MAADIVGRELGLAGWLPTAIRFGNDGWISAARRFRVDGFALCVLGWPCALGVPVSIRRLIASIACTSAGGTHWTDHHTPNPAPDGM